MKSEASLTETKTAFDRVRIAEAMHVRVIAVPGDAALVEVARIMSEQRVRCVVVTGAPEHSVAHLVVVDPLAGEPVGVLSTLDLARVAAASPA